MLFTELKRFQSYLIFLILIGLMIFTLWIRSLTPAAMDIQHYLTFASPDIWYNFRQIELMVHNYPAYSWFDPMTAFPDGKTID
jgi:asparagine N-glycosylation enzyme membrane subunit Stt3